MAALPDIRACQPSYRTFRIDLNTGDRCNYACTYCTQSDQVSSLMDRQYGLDLIDEITRVYSEGFIFYAGGEPCVIPWFTDWVERAHQNGFMQGVVTNGTRSDQYYLDLSRIMRVMFFSVHYEHLTEFDQQRVLLERVRHVDQDGAGRVVITFMYLPGHEQDILRGIDYCNRHGLRYCVRRIQFPDGRAYTDQQERWLTELDVTNFTSIRVLGPDGWIDTNPEVVLQQGQNRYRGWSCRAGCDGVSISGGVLKRAGCGIKDGTRLVEQGLVRFTDPVICDQATCNCAANIALTKSGL
ncbi:radical SAM protein [Magnetovibrio sp. PR-2]|uniref:radical SAM protein n=1 Tax=Magnetovibrio sp. PR-2 TaxID=3120356 RepID=UPI002FCE104B